MPVALPEVGEAPGNGGLRPGKRRKAMRIGVLGTGMVGRTISAALAERGHDVRTGSRTAGDGKVTFADAAAHGEVLFNCTGGAVALDALTAAGADNLAGKLLIDVSNPLDGSGGVFTSASESVAEQIQQAFPHARVVKSLNTVNCHVMVEPSLIPGDHVIFVCGDDDGAKDDARTLLGQLGWPVERIIDLGDITGARAVEHYVLLWIAMWRATGTLNFNIAIATGA
jgi:8-hydroxy-5-deazaflavin:NADPH oxidoreductase